MGVPVGRRGQRKFPLIPPAFVSVIITHVVPQDLPALPGTFIADFGMKSLPFLFYQEYSVCGSHFTGILTPTPYRATKLKNSGSSSMLQLD